MLHVHTTVWSGLSFAVWVVFPGRLTCQLLHQNPGSQIANSPYELITMLEQKEEQKHTQAHHNNSCLKTVLSLLSTFNNRVTGWLLTFKNSPTFNVIQQIVRWSHSEAAKLASFKETLITKKRLPHDHLLNEWSWSYILLTSGRIGQAKCWQL